MQQDHRQEPAKAILLLVGVLAMTAVTMGVIAAEPDQGSASATGVSSMVATPHVLTPAGGTTVSGTTALDASAPAASSVAFYLYGGSYGFSGKKLCAATRTEVGWVCDWSATTVPSGSYTLVSGASSTGGSAFSAGVSLAVTNSNLSTTPAPATAPLPGAGSEGAIPDAPASIGAPTTMVLDDEFTGNALNTSLWSPDWFGNGGVANNTVMESDNVSVDANGLELKLGADSTGGLVSSDPGDGQPGHTGFEIAPTPGHPVYVEFKATLPTTGGQIANWPALWLTGQQWPSQGEIDVMEGFGDAEYHIEYGPPGSGFGSGISNPGGVGGTSGGTHTYGVLWSTTGVTFVYDGVVVGTETASLSGPMFLVMENSLASGGPPLLPATMTVRYVRVWH